MIYGEEGKMIREQIWRETLDKLKFANVEAILNNLND